MTTEYRGAAEAAGDKEREHDSDTGAEWTKEESGKVGSHLGTFPFNFLINRHVVTVVHHFNEKVDTGVKSSVTDSLTLLMVTLNSFC